MNVVERMYPVISMAAPWLCSPLIKNLPVIQKSMEQSLELYDYFRKTLPTTVPAIPSGAL